MPCVRISTVDAELSTLLQCFLIILCNWILLNLCCFMPVQKIMDHQIIYSGKLFRSVSLKVLVKLQVQQVESSLYYNIVHNCFGDVKAQHFNWVFIQIIFSIFIVILEILEMYMHVCNAKHSYRFQIIYCFLQKQLNLSHAWPLQQGQIGRGPEQSDLVGGTFAHGSEVGTGLSLKSLPSQALL